MEKLITVKKNVYFILLMLFISIPCYIAIIFCNKNIYQPILLIFLLLSNLIYQTYYKKKVAKFFAKKKYKKINVTEKHIRYTFYVIGSILLLPAIMILVISKGKEMIPIFFILLILFNFQARLMYIGEDEDILIYNNKILSFDKISNYEKIDKRMISGIQYSIGDKKQLLKFQNKLERDKVYQIFVKAITKNP